MAIDLDTLWDYSKPELSEQRLRAALAGASPDDALILQTQIARTHGLRRDFAQAREILASIRSAALAASPEAQVHWWLEYGRTLASTTHPAEALTAEARAQARDAYTRAHDLAQAARLDVLAIDALHMMVVVDDTPADQLKWDLLAIDAMNASTQPDAKLWAGSLHNNVGYALHLLGRYDEALAQFELSKAAHAQRGKAANVRIADWMIAWTMRAQKRYAEARDIQLRLEREWDASGEPDPYVYEELEILYRELGDAAAAQRYADKLAATRR